MPGKSVVHESPLSISWVNDLSSQGANTNFPTGDAGIEIPKGRAYGSRTHIEVTADTGVPVARVLLYAKTFDGVWGWIASVNADADGNPQDIAVDETKWSADANSIAMIEMFLVAPGNFARLASRIQGWSAGSWNTRIGLEQV